MNPRLSHTQKRLLTAALLSGAASAGELARWSGLNIRSVHRIARVFSVTGRKRCYNQFVRMWWNGLKKLRPPGPGRGHISANSRN